MSFVGGRDRAAKITAPKYCVESVGAAKPLYKATISFLHYGKSSGLQVTQANCSADLRPELALCC